MDKILELAEQIGFSHFSYLDVSTLELLQRVRDMCTRDKCNKYNKSWSCPPRVGNLEDISKKISKYSTGILVQTVSYMDDEFDMESVKNADKEHKEKFDTLVRQTRYFFSDCMPMASGTCTRCKKCTYPDRRCRFPERVFPSMEAYGLMVRDVCEKNGLNYYYGKRTITFTACILLD